MLPDFLVGSLLILVVIVAVVAVLVVTGMERGRRANLRAEAANARLMELNAAAAAAGQSLDLRRVFSDTLTVILGRPSVRSAWIAYAPPSEDSLSVTALSGSPPVAHELPERFLRATRSVMANAEPSLLGAPDLTPSPADADLVTAVVPMWVDDRLVGAFGVSSQGSNPLAYDIEHLNDISWQLGLALDNVQHYQEARKSLRELTRTQAALEGYVRLATEAQEEERKRLARELHDETIQSLVIIKGYLETASANGGAAESQLESADAMLTRTIDGLRRLSRDLRPAILDDLGLHHAIESLVAEFTGRTGIRVTVTAPEGQRRPEAKTELVLFRIAQEALRNVEKHSGAGRVSLGLHLDDGGATLTVADDGCGFEPGEVSIDRDDATGLGLTGMQERAKSIDGTLRVKSHPGRGALIEVRVPVR
ncbi:MAG TPA: sensor histidine kinase [Thermoleophilia bacterium]|nr:sensor histidine kinase [Thermoleophilia bacterium]